MNGPKCCWSLVVSFTLQLHESGTQWIGSWVGHTIGGGPRQDYNTDPFGSLTVDT
jgi:hypothetical protein